MQLPKCKAYIELIHNANEADNERDRQVTYVCGLFIAKTIAIPNVINFVTTYVPVIPYSETFRKIEELGRGCDDDEEIQVETTSRKIKLLCSFTLKRLEVPVRGQWCTHFDCFDLETYLEMNGTT